MEDPIKMDDFGVPIIFGNTHIVYILFIHGRRMHLDMPVTTCMNTCSKKQYCHNMAFAFLHTSMMAMMLYEVRIAGNLYQRLDLVWYLIKGSPERYRFFDTDTSDTYLNEIEPSPKMA